MTAMYSNPASSAVRATLASSRPSPSGPRGVEKSGICSPTFMMNYLPLTPSHSGTGLGGADDLAGCGWVSGMKVHGTAYRTKGALA